MPDALNSASRSSLTASGDRTVYGNVAAAILDVPRKQKTTR